MKKRALALVGITILVMCIPLAIIAHKNQQAEMTSSIFDWNTIKVAATKTGERRQFFQAPTPTLDELECHVTTLNPGESAHAPHQHPDEEVVIIKEGTLEATVNGIVKRVGPGSVLFFSSNQMHGAKNVGTTQAVYHVIKWKSAKTKK
jgi:quercetin dioxygenase-like cupin family protein